MKHLIEIAHALLDVRSIRCIRRLLEVPAVKENGAFVVAALTVCLGDVEEKDRGRVDLVRFLEGRDCFGEMPQVVLSRPFVGLRLCRARRLSSCGHRSNKREDRDREEND